MTEILEYAILGILAIAGLLAVARVGRGGSLPDKVLGADTLILVLASGVAAGAGVTDDATFLGHGHYSELAGGLGQRHLDAANRHVCLRIDVVGEKRAVVHLVNVVACEDQNVFRAVGFDNIQTLVYRIRGALIPSFVLHPLLGRN